MPQFSGYHCTFIPPLLIFLSKYIYFLVTCDSLVFFLSKFLSILKFKPSPLFGSAQDIMSVQDLEENFVYSMLNYLDVCDLKYNIHNLKCWLIFSFIFCFVGFRFFRIILKCIYLVQTAFNTGKKDGGLTESDISPEPSINIWYVLKILTRELRCQSIYLFSITKLSTFLKWENRKLNFVRFDFKIN